MAEKRIVIDQKLCDTVEILMKGTRDNVRRVVDLLGISPATVRRIKAAYYNANTYHIYNMERKKKEKEKAEKEQPAEDRRPFSLAACFTEENRQFTPPPIEDLQEQLGIALVRPITPEEVHEKTMEYIGEEPAAPRQMEMELPEEKEEIETWLVAIHNQLSNIDDKLGQLLRRMDRYGIQ